MPPFGFRQHAFCDAVGSPSRSTGGLQAERDAGDTREQRVEKLTIQAPACAPAPQQVDLHQVHRVEIGRAQQHRALQLRPAVGHARMASRAETSRRTSFALSSEMVSWWSMSEFRLEVAV